MLTKSVATDTKREPEDTSIEFSNGVKIGGNNKPVFIKLFYSFTQKYMV